MKKFILCRTDDRASHSWWWILGYALIFWIVSRIVTVVMVMVATAVYKSLGIDPSALTQFAGNPDVARKLFGSAAIAILNVALLAPVIEECVFRLGLSFRRWQVALGLAFVPIMAVYSRGDWTSLLIAAAIAAVIFAAIYWGTRSVDWTNLRRRWLVPAMWVASILFGLVHLLAFKGLTLELLPYALCIICAPMFGGFCCTYLRVNLGFWWGVAFHIFNNLPAIFMLLK